MRISDRQTSRNYLTYLDKAKTAYQETNMRIASGNRFTRISDDVSAATKALRVRTELNKAANYYNNVKAVNEHLKTTEDALTAMNDILSKVHVKAIAGLNEPSGESGRQALANEIMNLRDELLQFANTSYNDFFVLAGTSAKTPPFSTDASGNLLYNGVDVNLIERDADGYFYMDAGVRREIPMDGDAFVDVGLGITLTGSTVDAGTAMKTSYSGLEILGFGKDANGRTNNVFNMLTEIVDSLKNFDADKLGAYDEKLTGFIDSFRGRLTDIGAKTSFLDTIESRVTNNIDNFSDQISRLVGADDAEEAINLSINDYVLKAVLAMGAKIIPVSLMDFLN